MEKELPRIDKNEEEIIKEIAYILQFIESSLSNLVDNLSEKIHRIKYKYTHNDKKCEICKIK